MLARKIAPALAAGCTVVCKPANETPLSALALAHLAMQAGIPAGVINVLCGKTEEIGQTLTGSTQVRKLTFTGSTRVGKMLAADCAATMKRTTMELGGNAPFIVFADADLDAAVAGVVASKYRNAGQTCVCANRVLVEDEIYDTFAERLASSAQAFKLGDGRDEAVTMGPLIHQGAAAKVVNLVDDALAEGALVRQGCGISDLGSGYVEPGVLIDVTPQMRIAQEDIVGPVVGIIPFENEQEAVAIANDTPYGLAAYLQTGNPERARRVAAKLRTGSVHINGGGINYGTPFGGYKQSGNGREGGIMGLEDYLETKTLHGLT